MTPFCLRGHSEPNPRSLRLKQQSVGKQFAIDKRIKSGHDRFDGCNPHWHDYVQIWYTLNGSYGHRLMDKSYLMKSGSLMVVPPFHTHLPYHIGYDAVEIVSCDFSIGFLNGIFSNPADIMAFFKPIVFPGPRTPSPQTDEKEAQQAEMLFHEVYAEAIRDPKQFMVLQKAKVAGLLRFILNMGSKTVDTSHSALIQRYYKPVQSSIDYIDRHHQNKLYLEDLCKQIFMSRNNFCNIFKQVTGNTFSEYMSCIRIQHAGADLVTTDKPILEVAQDHGFQNKVHFYRQFQYYMGRTPREYRIANSRIL